MSSFTRFALVALAAVACAAACSAFSGSDNSSGGASGAPDGGTGGGTDQDANGAVQTGGGGEGGGGATGADGGSPVGDAGPMMGTPCTSLMSDFATNPFADAGWTTPFAADSALTWAGGTTPGVYELTAGATGSAWAGQRAFTKYSVTATFRFEGAVFSTRSVALGLNASSAGFLHYTLTADGNNRNNDGNPAVTMTACDVTMGDTCTPGPSTTFYVAENTDYIITVDVSLTTAGSARATIVDADGIVITQDASTKAVGHSVAVLAQGNGSVWRDVHVTCK